MQIVTQNLKTGQLSVAEVPRPVVRPDGVLVRSRASLISAGTEKTMLELGQKSLAGKARERPDLVRKTLDKLQRDGFAATLSAVRDQLDRLEPLGYSACGEVCEVGSRAGDLQVGDVVACAGAGYACHAEINYVPRLLAARLPDGVGLEAGAYATVGAIALQGIRNADVRVGETVCVLGLGLLGQLSVQILRASGCQVVAADLSATRLALAAEQGANLTAHPDKVSDAVHDFTHGMGADAVLITAATTSNQPVETAARVARDRGRVVMVGVTGMDLPRRDYFAKELSFVVSRSYGPGRYDPDYEEHGHDYPAGYVRWTEHRNMQAFLQLVADGSVRPDALTTHRFPVDQAVAAYELILKGDEPHLGVVLEYGEVSGDGGQVSGGRCQVSGVRCQERGDRSQVSGVREGSVGVSFLGVGNFARGTLLRELRGRDGVQLRGVVSASGVSAESARRKFGFDFCVSDVDEILEDAATDCVFVTTRHAQHAELAVRALQAGKHVFVEKPLAIDVAQLAEVEHALQDRRGQLMVGFNRRFAPLGVALQQHFANQGPLQVVYRCNAGRLPVGHWIADPREGGRIVGEACHFVDFCCFLTGSTPRDVFASSPSVDPADDSAALTLKMTDGSVCQIVYSADGASRQAKEYVEVLGGGRCAVLHDFRRLECFTGNQVVRQGSRFRQEKGHRQELAAWLACLRGEAPCPIQPHALLDTTWATLAALESIRRGEVVRLPEWKAELTR